MTRTIVMAWKGKDPTSKYYGKGLAAIWVNNGTSQDLRNAREAAARHGYRIMVFPNNDPRCLDKARERLDTE